MCDIVTSCSAGYLSSTPLLGRTLLSFKLLHFSKWIIMSLVKKLKLLFGLWTDLNYIEDSAGGPDVTVGILAKMDKVTLLQVSKLIFLNAKCCISSSMILWFLQLRFLVCKIKLISLNLQQVINKASVLFDWFCSLRHGFAKRYLFIGQRQSILQTFIEE